MRDHLRAKLAETPTSAGTLGTQGPNPAAALEKGRPGDCFTGIGNVKPVEATDTPKCGLLLPGHLSYAIVAALGLT